MMRTLALPSRVRPALPRTAAIALACMLVSGCTTVGNGRLVQLDEAAAGTLLVPGKTTQSEVRESLGQGTVIRFQSGYETWHYVYRKGLAKGWDYVPYINLIAARIGGDEKELVILFDETGTLRRWSLDERHGGLQRGG